MSDDDHLIDGPWPKRVPPETPEFPLDLPPLPRPTTTVQRSGTVPMTLNMLIARLTDLRDAHGGSLRVLLHWVDMDLEGNTILREPNPEVHDLLIDWPDSCPWFTTDSTDIKMVTL